MIVTDEAEKVGAYDRREFPLDCLLPLLEPSTAAVARDKYLDVPMRCDGVIFVFCCNTLNGLSRPLLDRCVVLEVPDLAPDERTVTAEAILDEVLVAYDLPPAHGRATGAAALAARHGLRRARTLLLTALGLAVAVGRKLPQADNVRAAADLIGDHGEAPRREPAGFVLHR